VPYGQYILDFYCPETALVLELDRGQHYTNEGIEKDMARDKYLQKRGLKVLRFSDRDVLSNLNGVMQRIYEEFENLKNIEKTPP
jgi:very-short-patch-repair endonuclease